MNENNPTLPNLSPPLPHLSAQHTPKPGGFWKRFLGTFLDGMISGVLMVPFLIPIYAVLFGVLMNAESTSEPPNPAVAGIFLLIYPIMFGVQFLYYGWFYKNKGASPGKMALGLKVVMFDSGERLSYGRAFLQEVIGKMFINSMTMGIGFLIAAFREDKRGLHDLIAGTQVLDR